MHIHTDQSLLLVVLMWQTMMTAMMLPVVLPWASMVAVLGGTSRVQSVTGFLGGYFGAWLAYSIVAAVVQVWLQRGGWLDLDTKLNAAVGGGVLVAAGLFQFTPLKRSCLTHCRSPLSYFLSRWHDGPLQTWRIGLAHGLYCVGCCWALMAVAFAVGLMNLMWMAVLTAIVAAEQLLPWGEWVGRACGLALAAWGLRLLLG